MLELTMFGTFSARVNGRVVDHFRTLRVQALLTYLVVQAEQGKPVQRRETLTQLLWPGMPQGSALQNLRQTLYELRKVVAAKETPFIAATRHTIGVNTAYSLTSDIGRFSHYLAQHPDRWDAAINLYQGGFLRGFSLPDAAPFNLWVEAQRVDYRRQVLDALTSLVEMQVERNEWLSAENNARRQLTIDPLREKAHQQLMTALALNGKRSEALAQYDRCRSLLENELAVLPAQTTETLVTAIRNGHLAQLVTTVQPINGYEVQELIGTGNFGAAYRAVQTSIGRDVAVKIIRDKYANDPEFIRRFEVEAQVIAQLEHPHIVPLYDFWREPGSAYLVMRWLKGGSLADSLNGGWQPERALTLVQQVADGLEAAHRRNIIHRDIKPANILLDEEGNGYLSDFGIAISGDDTQTDAQLLLSASSVTPEQTLRQPITPQADIYSFGVLLYELLTGQPPFATTTPSELAQRHVYEPLPSVRKAKPLLSEALDQVIQKATAKQPQQRYASPLALAEAFAQAVRGGALVASLPTVVRDDIDNPYKGLQAFGEVDAGLFFGRIPLIQSLTQRIADERFVAIVGPSGSGKSSLVRAGLVPALRAGAVADSAEWFIATMLPGAHPYEELESALLRVAVDEPPTLMGLLQDGERGLIRAAKRVLPSGTDQQLLLIIDQFEELFTLAQPERTRQFLSMLASAVRDPHSAIRVVATLRADFYDRPLLHDDVGDLMRHHTDAITPLTSAQLAEAIRQPAALVGVAVEPDLVTTMVADVREQPGGLPLLQYALTELFDRRSERRMTLADYQAMGGILGVLGRKADEIYEGLDSAEKVLAKQIFLRLVTLGEGVEDTRRRVLQSELEQLSVVSEQLTVKQSSGSQFTIHNLPFTISSAFASARLLSFDHDPITREPTVEVAHEALLREWPRLRGWLDESRDDLRLQRRLNAAVADWIDSGRDNAYLLRGSQIERFKPLFLDGGIELTNDESELIETSATRQRKAKRELDWIRVQAKLVRVPSPRTPRPEDASISSVILTASEKQYILESRRAEKKREAHEKTRERRELEQARLATARELAANVATKLSEDSELSLLLAMKSLEIAHTYEGEAALHRALQSQRLRKTTEIGEGRTIMRRGPNGLLLFDQPLPTKIGDPVSVWDIETGDKLYEVPYFDSLDMISHTRMQFATTFHTSVDENIQDCELRVYDMLTGAEVDHPISRNVRIDRRETHLYYVHPNWEHIIWGEVGGRIVVENVWHGSTVLLDKHDVSVVGMGFSETNSLIVSIDNSGKTIVWDLEDTVTTGEISIIAEWQAEVGSYLNFGDVGQVIFDRNGQTYVATTPNYQGTTVAIWVLENSTAHMVTQQTERLTNTVTSFAVSGNGTMLATVSPDGIVRVSDIQNDEGLFDLIGKRKQLYDIAFINNDSQLLGSSINNEQFVWDATPIQNEVRAFGQLQGRAGKVATDIQGRYGAAGHIFGRAVVYNLETGKEHLQLTNEMGGRVVSFHPDGERIAAAGHDGLVQIYDVESGELLLEWQALDGRLAHIPKFWAGIWGLAFSPNGRLLATSASDGFGKVWDADSGDVLAQFEFAPSQHIVHKAEFSPDGRLLAFHGGDFGIRVYDVLSYDGESMELLWQFDRLPWGMGLSFSPDSARLAVVGSSGHISVWNMATGQPSYKMPTLSGLVTDVKFTPDGAYFITADGNGTVVWDAHTGRELFKLAEAGVANEFVVTAQGRLFVGDFISGNIAELTLYLDDALALARERVTREMTEQECLQYLRSADCSVSFAVVDD